MPYVVITQTGFQEALDEIRGFRGAMRALQPIIKQAGEYILDFLTNDVYESEGKVFGNGWPQVQMPYAYYKFLKYGPQLTLVATGQMRASNVLYTSGDMIIIKNEAKSKSGHYYAKGHQDGTSFMPKRQLYGLPERQRLQVAKIIMDGIERRARGR